MSRIKAIEPDHATAESRELLERVRGKLGKVPNLLKGLANSPAALEAYLSLTASLGRGTLGPRLREQVAVATAAANACEYCAAAHTAVGKSLRIEEPELRRNLAGRSGDPRTAAALSFVAAVIGRRGNVSDAELAAVRAAGFTDGQVTELVALVALNVFTNYFNNVARTELDWPAVTLPEAAAA